MDKPLVSIIIPVYNAAQFIEETISSALQQTWPNKEIIVVDDGSTDNSLTIIKGYEGALVKVFSQKNKGPAAARNKGLAEANGDYIQFLDADDLLSSTKIEDQVNLLAGYPGYIGVCGFVHFLDGENPYAKFPEYEWYEEGNNDPVDFLIKLYGGCPNGPKYGAMIAMHAWLCPREIINKAGNWNEDLTVDDDGEFFCRVVLASNGIKYAQNAISYYRKFKNANTWSAQKTYEAYKKMLQATQLKAKHLLAKTNNPNASIALSRLLWDNAFTFYPQYMDLAKKAEFEAKAVAPDYNYNPYTGGFKQHVAKVVGWKAVAYLQYLKRYHTYL